MAVFIVDHNIVKFINIPCANANYRHFIIIDYYFYFKSTEQRGRERDKKSIKWLKSVQAYANYEHIAHQRASHSVHTGNALKNCK